MFCKDKLKRKGDNMKVDRQYLQKRLEKAKPGLADKEVIEQSTSFIFVNGYIVTFNDEVAISFPSPFGDDVEGAVSAKEFMGVLAKFRDKEVDIKSTDNELLLKGKNKKVGLALIKDINLPMADIINFDPEGVEWIDLAVDTMEAIEFCKFSVSKNTNKPVLNSLHMNGDLIESSDNYRITRFFMDKVTFPDPILIAINNAKILPNYTNLVKYAVYDGWAHFSDEDNNIVVSCRLLEEKFPDVSDFLVKGDISIELPEGLDEILQTAEVVIDHSKIDNERVTINVTSNKVKVSCEGPNSWYVETLKYKQNTKNKDISFEINPTLLREILKLMTSANLNEKAGVMNFIGDKFIHVISLL